jgi:predicted porin
MIALAVAAVASGAAFAQTNVTIYGNVDMGYMHRSGHNGAVSSGLKGQNDLQSIGSESYIGFKGVEDLGNGVKALFDIAYRIAPDANTGLATAAHQYVGLTGSYGTAVAGYLDGIRYGIYGRYDPFGNYSVGNFQQMTTHYARAANAVAYISPTFAGFNFILAHATNTQAREGSMHGRSTANNSGNSGDDRLYSINLNYNNGPFSAALDYETTSNVSVTDNKRLYVATAAGSYDFGVAKLGVIVDKIHGQKNSLIGVDDRRNYLLGVTVPVGNVSILGSFGRVVDKAVSDKDANKWSVGARYSLSKRTTLYADYSHISNDGRASYQINPLGNASTSTDASALGVSGIDFGIKHSF